MAATTIRSSTCGRISFGSREVTHTVAAIPTAVAANTMPGFASDQSMPRSYSVGEIDRRTRCERDRARRSATVPHLRAAFACRLSRLPSPPDDHHRHERQRQEQRRATDVTTLSDRSRNSAAASPCTKMIGPNTSSVVSVPAVSGPATSSVAR